MNRKEQFLFANLVLLILTKILAIVSLGRKNVPQTLLDTAEESKLIKLLFSSENEEK